MTANGLAVRFSSSSIRFSRLSESRKEDGSSSRSRSAFWHRHLASDTLCLSPPDRDEKRRRARWMHFVLSMASATICLDFCLVSRRLSWAVSSGFAANRAPGGVPYLWPSPIATTSCAEIGRFTEGKSCLEYAVRNPRRVLISPDIGFASPRMHFNRVVFPLPLGPHTRILSDSITERENLLNTMLRSYPAERLLIWISWPG